jgi:hypothetical protein
MQLPLRLATMLTSQRHPIRNLFTSFLLLGTAACAAAPRAAAGPRFEAEVPLVERAIVTRLDGAWQVAGTARCEWPATPARTSLVLRALDAEGRELGAIPVSTELRPQTRRHKRDQLFGFVAAVPAPADAARLVLARD